MSNLSTLAKETYKTTDRNGVQVDVTSEFHHATGVLDIGGKKINAKVKVTTQLNAPGRDGTVNGIRLNVYATIDAKELGLRDPDVEAVDFRISMTGTTTKEAPPRQARR